MKPKHNEGFSLVEIMVAIALLSLLVVPTCTCLLMAIQINTRTDDMRQAQLAVSSAVETLMAEGISEEFAAASLEDEDSEEFIKHMGRFSDVTIDVAPVSEGEGENQKFAGYYDVRVTSKLLDSVTVQTKIREQAPTVPPATDPETTESEQTPGEGGGS